MNTKQLSYIISIAEQGNLSAAALSLGVSQPALSKYLSQLENELGVEFFLRHKKKLHLTAAGKIYVESAKQILSVKDQTYQTIAGLSGGYKKTITVGVTPLRGAIAMAKLFPHFRKRYPNVNITLKEQYAAQLRQSVLNHSIDLALTTCIDLEDPEVLFISSHEEDLALFVPAFHPLASLASSDLHNLTPIEIHHFQDIPFILGNPGSTIRHLSDIIFQQNQMNPTIVYETDNNLILQNMAQNGAGATLLPRSRITPCDSLVYFSLKPNYSMHMAVMAPKDRELSKEERCIIALNFSSEFNFNYRFSPNPIALEIMKEFPISESLY